MGIPAEMGSPLSVHSIQFNLFYCNVQGISCLEMILTLKVKPQIICLSEHWINSNSITVH